MQRRHPKREMYSLRIAPETKRLIVALADAISRRENAAIRYTMTDVVEIAVHRMAEKEKVK
jgi:hypothetical protein